MEEKKSQVNQNTVTSTPSTEMIKACQFFIDQKANALFLDGNNFLDVVMHREYPTVAPIPQFLMDTCDIDTEKIQGHTVFTLTPKEKPSDLHIIYTHGGGWVLELIAPHWDMIHKLIQDNGAKVTVPIYPLAPESTNKEAYKFLEEVYRKVINETPANKVILCGDSAGGGLAIGQCFHYRDLGLPLPALVIGFSPCVDMTLSNPEIPELQKKDVILAVPGGKEAAKKWIGDSNPKSPTLSPLYGNLSGLPPMRIFIGTSDILLPDNRLFKEKMQEVDGDVQLYEYAGGFHVFVCIPTLPESEDAYGKVKQAIAELVKDKY